jgi:hypothetical protein
MMKLKLKILRPPVKPLAIAVVFLLMLTVYSCQSSKSPKSPLDETPSQEDAKARAYKEAEKKVEEARGEPVGRKAQITIPKELQHYADRRRFLAIQFAAWGEFRNEIPQGYLELLELIQKGGLVEMEKLGDDYLLYGVGETADTEPFSYYDAATGENITLYENVEEFAQAQSEFTDAMNQLLTQIANLKTQIASSNDKALKSRLNFIMKESEAAFSEASLKKNLSEIFYKDPVRREMLFARYAWLANAAANFSGKSYDLKNPEERRALKMRLLSFLRPEARAMILQIAARYKEKFGRHLPVTSLIRTTQYQNQLRETNANAANVEVPPHTTGLAFDIFNAWMTAEEQNFLMNLIAKLESSGQLEALRENRDHIHVFAFARGKPPSENHIEQALQ